MAPVPYCHYLIATLICLVLTHTDGVSAALDGLCPPLGPVLPAPTSPSASLHVQSALTVFEEALRNVTSNLNVSAVSVGVHSIHEVEPMLVFHHTPPKLDARGVKQVDSDTLYRLASTSKIFPVLAILKTPGMDLNDPITKYLPELRSLNEQAQAQNAIWAVDWDDITLGALASHHGIPADLPLDLTTDPAIDWTEIGFPSVHESLLLNCSLRGDPPCGRKVFWDLFGHRAPVYPPFTTSVYSNIGFALLGWAVESVTNIPLSDYLRDSVWEPTGMHHTYASKPDDSLGAIPVDEQWWNATMGFERAAGDYYSSLSDMLRFGISILSNKQLSPVKTRRWLKPVAATSASNLLLGTPWEIYRFSNVTTDGRLVEIYTKMGNLFDYNSNLVLIPDYGLVIDVLTAGPETGGGTIMTITTEALKNLLPALEEAGKDESRISFVGNYVDSSSNSSLTLSLNDEGPGIAVTNWVVRGTDVRESYAKVGTAFVHQPPQENMVRFRLYPTGLETDTQSAWRGVFTVGTPEELEGVESGFLWPMGTCYTWAQLDRNQYALQGQDHFVFTVEKERGGTKAVTVELPAYRVTLERASPSKHLIHTDEDQKPISHVELEGLLR
ncbi:beta-lactamase/transpeptidase-like protein [Xylariales sp. AK1849]|nr:beta-lactamase/transpeptidase-like protein [Xylariales sp. AK1849]